MQNTSVEMSLMEPEEREMVEYIWNLIPSQDRAGMTPNDVLMILDEMDNYLEDKGLLEYDESTGEATYLDGDIDETEQLEYVRQALLEDKRSVTSVQIQLVMDAEMQYGIEHGYYTEED